MWWFAGCHNVRELDTIAQMGAVVVGRVGKRLIYRHLIANNGPDKRERVRKCLNWGSIQSGLSLH